MKRLILLLALLAFTSLAWAEAPNQVWEELRIPAYSWTTYGNVTGSAQPVKIWPAATSGGGVFSVALPNDMCTNQPIDPKLYYTQNGTWANKTAVEFVMTYQVFKNTGHHQGVYSSSQRRNNTANMITNSTMQSVQFAQIPPNKITPGGMLAVTVYRKGQLATDNAGNTTIPNYMSFKVLRCRAD